MTENTTTAASGAASLGEEQAFEAWYKMDCAVAGVGAKLAAKAAWKARAALAAPAAQEAEPAVPPGFALVPMRMNREMERVVADEDGWQWEDLLAAACAISESDYTAIMRNELTDDEIRESFTAQGVVVEDAHLEAVREILGNIPRPQADAGAPETPEGCTPADAQILRQANHELAAESFELQTALRGIVDQAGKALARFDIAPQADAGAVAVPDGFTAWSGGEQPAETRGKRVQVILRNGRTPCNRSVLLRWCHGPSGSRETDIVAYKLADEQPAHTAAAAPQAPAAPTAAAEVTYAPLPKPYSAAAALGLDDLYTSDDMRAYADAHRAAPAPAAGAAPTLDAADLAILSAGAKSGDPGALALAAQLAGVPACSRCGYVKHHCRCAAPAQEAEEGWMPIESAPDGERVLLGPRHAPVVGTVHRPEHWHEEQEPTATVVHYNGTTLVAGYRCSEWRRLPGVARARQEGGS